MTVIGAEEDSIPYEFSTTSVARTEPKAAGFDETGAPSTNGEAEFAKKKENDYQMPLNSMKSEHHQSMAMPSLPKRNLNSGTEDGENG